MRPAIHHLVLVALATTLVLGATACGNDSSDGSPPTTQGAGQPASDASTDDDDGSEDDGSHGGTDAPATGRATLVIGDETWEFTKLQCGFGAEETGVEGSEFNMAASEGSISLYAAIDADGSYIEIADIAAMDDGGLEMTTDAPGSEDPVFTISGRSVSAEATFVSYDEVGEPSELDGTLTVDCP
jgi:hypothetical protein